MTAREWNPPRDELVYTGTDRRTYGAGLSRQLIVLEGFANSHRSIFGMPGLRFRVCNEAAAPFRGLAATCEHSKTDCAAQCIYSLLFERSKLFDGAITFSQGDG